MNEYEVAIAPAKGEAKRSDAFTAGTSCSPRFPRRRLLAFRPRDYDMMIA